MDKIEAMLDGNATRSDLLHHLSCVDMDHGKADLKELLIRFADLIERDLDLAPPFHLSRISVEQLKMTAELVAKSFELGPATCQMCGEEYEEEFHLCSSPEVQE